ncbi:MAG: hypothetical protein J6R35_01170, partial [Clostridia bacterium]|nr:hypothetical protein [Clostridia bacterium]
MKDVHSNHAVKALVKLELNSRFADIRLNTVGGVLKAVLGLIAIAAIYYLYVTIAESIILSFYVYNRESLFLKLAMSIIGYVFAIAGVSSIVKSLFFSGDNELLVRFPVKVMDVFTSKVLVQGVFTFVYITAILLPLMIVYGNVTKAPISFYGMIPVGIILTWLTVFGVSILFAIPFMRVKTLVKDKYVLTLIFSTIVIAALFAIYMIVVKELMKFMQTKGVSFFSDGMMGKIFTASTYFYPFAQVSELMEFENLILSAPIAIGLPVVVVIIDFLMVKKYYLKIMLRNLEIEGSSFSKASNDVVRPHFGSLLKKDFLEIFRSFNYSFQYLAMSLSAPIMAYFSTDLAVTIGKDKIGELIAPSLAIMVILLFVSILVSFAATTVSREGDTFYMTKLSPVPYNVQILAKFTLYMIVSGSIVILSCLAIFIGGFVDVKT